MAFNGLSTLNIELTSRCNKSCWMCGRRRIERNYPELANWGDMDYELVKSISEQIPQGIVVQFHDNGEPLLYPRLGEAINLFNNQIRCLDTNGKMLMEKADEIINNLDTITISTFADDKEADEQWRIVSLFLKERGNRKPRVILRALGGMVAVRRYDSEIKTYNLPVAYRRIHDPCGSYNYWENKPIIPEIGICLEALHHLVIKRNGKVTPCVRFDPLGENIIGDLRHDTLEKIWNEEHKYFAQAHVEGRRNFSKLCAQCEYWGIPVG